MTQRRARKSPAARTQLVALVLALVSGVVFVVSRTTPDESPLAPDIDAHAPTPATGVVELSPVSPRTPETLTREPATSASVRASDPTPPGPANEARIVGACRATDGRAKEDWSGLVTLTDTAGNRRSAQLSTGGRFLLDVPAPARYVAVLDARDATPLEVTIDLVPGERSLEFEVDVRRSWLLRLELVDPAGRPFVAGLGPARRALGAQLRPVASRLRMTPGEAVAPSAGIASTRARRIDDDAHTGAWFELEGTMAERGWSCVVLGDRVLASQSYVAGQTCVIVMDPGALSVALRSVRCRVSDAMTHTPIEGVRVRWRGELAGLNEVLTDSAGFAQLDDVLSGEGTLSFQKRGWFARPRVLAAGTEALDVGVVAMYPTRTLRGRVVGAPGPKVVLTWVRGVDGPGRDEWSEDGVGRIVFDATGTFELPDLEPAEYFLSASYQAPFDETTTERIRAGAVPGWVRVDARARDVDSITVAFARTPEAKGDGAPSGMDGVGPLFPTEGGAAPR